MSSHTGSAGWVTLIRLLPRSTLSHLVGRLASVPVPRPLRAPVWRGFAALVGADLSEVRDPLEDFGCLQAFFTRALRDDAREIASADDAFVAPCDGAWGESGRVESGQLLQVKGRSYSLAKLLDEPDSSGRFEGGAFATFYLAPRDYHRFHAPCDVRVQRAVHVPGGLWPVNRIGVEGVADLFARNERICAHMVIGHAPATREPDLVMVAVGATLVGRVRLRFDDLVTHVRGATRTERTYMDRGGDGEDVAGDGGGAEGGVEVARGAEWGRFEFGSTIVLVARAGVLDLPVRPLGTPLRLGEQIGRLRGRDD